jgi:lipoate-protein ligase B
MQINDWHTIAYKDAVEKQLALIDVVADGGEEVICFCKHPPIVTLGRATQAADVFGWKGETFESSRGGRATYHGPSQIIVYPIIDLKREHKNLKIKDIAGYMRILENSVIDTLKEFGIASEARTLKQNDGSDSLTGVWVADKKIASIGIAVKKWITYHGVALNVLNDPLAFSGINPCGFKSSIMTSVEEVFQLGGRGAGVEIAGENPLTDGPEINPQAIQNSLEKIIFSYLS